MSSSSSTTQVVSFRDMGMYEPFQQLSGWENPFKSGINNITSNQNNSQGSSTTLEVDARPEADDNNRANYTSVYNNNSIEAEPSSNNKHDEERINDKMKRRLAQNREAARKSRLRKKAHVQQLEESRLKLSQLEQELVRARQQGLCVRNSSDTSYLGPAGNMNSGIAAFEMEYTHWLEEQNRRVSEIRTALQAHIGDIELKMLVDTCLNHYANLFRMKADAAKADVFFLMSEMWRTSTEGFFQWIGVVRPSEFLNVVMPYVEPLTDQQLLEVRNLQQSSQQAEEALSQGLDKLQQAVLYPGTRPTVLRIRFKFFLATLLHWLVSVVFEIAFNLRTELLWVICGGCFFQLMNWVVRSWIYRDPLFVNTSVSLLHSIITSASVVFILLNQCLAKGLDEMFDHSELWDMLQYRLYSGLIPSIVVHHLILLVCFTLALYRNVTINYLILTLICEMHSIFLHVRKLRRMAGIRDSNTALVKLEWVLNWTAFVFARCIPHILISVKLIKDAHKFGKGLELPMLWFVCCMTSAHTSLVLYLRLCY
ncbi:unnamed protein product [Arabidopsis arenosa]|uniref:Uncharacterized protein n=2 Tax=Arabidopsis arenosa TaxID=38785 RepID=A0A8S1ZHX9_ARAAE|nr:unnamed protein product [Arabidopsis arenosa]